MEGYQKFWTETKTKGNFGRKPKVLERRQNKIFEGNQDENFRRNPKQKFQKETRNFGRKPK